MNYQAPGQVSFRKRSATVTMETVYLAIKFWLTGGVTALAKPSTACT